LFGGVKPQRPEEAATMWDDYTTQLIAKERVAAFHAEAEAERLAALALGRRRPRRRLLLRRWLALAGRAGDVAHPAA
jgi:hypothetical protein